MKLEDILKQQVEIDELFVYLCKLHERLLVGDSSDNDHDPLETISLNKVRHDLIVCLNDFNTLNDMLISFDGAIKQEIQILEETRVEINDLKQRKTELLKERDQWTLNPNKVGSTDSNTAKNNSNNVIQIKTSYRNTLDQYIELVGIQNTTLFNHFSFIDQDNQRTRENEEEISLTPKETVNSLRLLNACQSEIQKEIEALKTLLRDLEKDSQFITNERRQMISLVENQKYQIENQLSSIENDIIKLLNKCGFSFPKNSNPSFSFASINNSSISETLLSIWNSRDNHDNIPEDTNIYIVIDHSDEFIDSKINALEYQLKFRKKNSTNLLADKQLWQDCVQVLEELEDTLQNTLLNIGKDSTSTLPSPSKLISMITAKIEYLKASLNNTNTIRLKDLINHEITNLQMACDELSFNSNHQDKIDSIETEKPSISTLNYDMNDCMNYTIRNSKPPLIIGKSPPKIGISNGVMNNIFHTPTNKKTK